jgi:microsomal dipeptidase-like Zn-dependent dipeptidase
VTVSATFKRRFLWLLTLLLALALGFFLFVPGIVERQSNKVRPSAHTISDRAKTLHQSLFVADLHGDTLLWQRDLLSRSGQGHIDLPRLEEGNVALQVFASVTKTPKGQNYDANSADSDNITLLSFAQMQPPRTWTSLLERSLWHAAKLSDATARESSLILIRTKADLEGLLARRKVKGRGTGALLASEGLHSLEGKLSNLDVLYKAGYRMAGLTHFFDNELAGSMHGLKKGGLTPLGRDVMKAMEAKGMVVDIAHSSHATVAEILALATKPVVSSHGGVQATCKVNRNLTDVEIRGVAKTGGVIGIGYWDAAICSSDPAAIAKAIKHVRDLVGIDHVGLGSDFDGATTTPFDTAGVVHVTQALLDAGFTDAEIAKVMGGNVFRVLSAVLPAA